MGLELGLGHPAPAGGVVAELGDVGELPLPGGVVHQADDADPVGGVELVELRLERLGAELGAQVQPVADAQRIGVVEPSERAGERARVLAVAGLAAGDQRADPERVEDGGDPGAGQLGVVGEDRRRLRPAHAGAGLEVALEVVGVKLDQAGAEEVAAADPRPRAARPARCRSRRCGRRGPRRCRSGCRPRGGGGRWRAPARAVAECEGRVACGDCSEGSGTTMGDWRRHAIYFAPPAGSPLAEFGADWLGWDPATGRGRDGFDLPGLPRRRAELVATPARYGFHATLKAPFRLGRGPRRCRARRGGGGGSCRVRRLRGRPAAGGARPLRRAGAQRRRCRGSPSSNRPA